MIVGVPTVVILLLTIFVIFRNAGEGTAGGMQESAEMLEREHEHTPRVQRAEREIHAYAADDGQPSIHGYAPTEHTSRESRNGSRSVDITATVPRIPPKGKG